MQLILSFLVILLGTLHSQATSPNQPTVHAPNFVFSRAFGGRRLFSRPYGPTGIAIQQDKHILITDASKNEVLMFDMNGKYLRSFGKTKDAKTRLKYPTGIVVFPDGKVMVADTGNHRIVIFDSDGKFIKTFGSEGEETGKLQYPRGVAVSPAGHIVIADTGNNRVQIFDGEGKFLKKFGSAASQEAGYEGAMDSPYDVAITPLGNILVADTVNSRVQIFDSEGQFLKEFGSEGTQNRQFAESIVRRIDTAIVDGIKIKPQSLFAVAVSSSGDIFVTDTGNHRIQIFDKEGQFLSMINTGGKAKKQSQADYSLMGLALSSTGELFVTDAGNSRVQVFRESRLRRQ